MPITQPSLREGVLNLFHVLEEFEVYDGESAILLDHLLNHIKVLQQLAAGDLSNEISECLDQWSRYVPRAPGDWSRARIGWTIDVLAYDCRELLTALTSLAAAGRDQRRRAEILNHVQARIPFLDYRYPRDPYCSAAEREEQPD